MLHENEPDHSNIDNIINQGNQILSPEHSPTASPHRSAAGSRSGVTELPPLSSGYKASQGKAEVMVKGAGEFPKVENLVALQQGQAAGAAIASQAGH